MEKIHNEKLKNVYSVYSSLHHRVHNGSGAHPSSYPMGTTDISLGIKRPEREADHSPPSSAEVKNAWSYTSIPQYVFMAWCLVKHRDNFTFYIFYMISRKRRHSTLYSGTVVTHKTVVAGCQRSQRGITLQTWTEKLEQY
jgi:hypothetical protein